MNHMKKYFKNFNKKIIIILLIVNIFEVGIWKML